MSVEAAPATLPRLYAIADAECAAAAGWDVVDLVHAFLEGGARLIQLRAKALGSAAFLEACRKALDATRAAGARLVVNDRADVAVLAGASALHVGQDDLPVDELRRLFPSLTLVGLSTHTVSQLEAAVGSAAGYLAVGPVFGTRTKDTGYDAVGLDLVARAASAVRAADGDGNRRRPLVAIGGITLERAAAVLAAGADSVAIISDLLSTGQPARRVQEYVHRLSESA